MSEIRDVYLWANEQLMVFDRAGQQMPEYQHGIEALPAVLREAPADCRYHVGEWRGWCQDVDRYHMEARATTLRLSAR